MNVSPAENPNSDPTKKSIFIKDLQTKDVVRSTFLVRSKGLRPQKNGQSYLHLQLADRTGFIEAKVWDNAESAHESLEEGNVVAIFGRVHDGAGNRHLTVQQWVPLPESEINWDDFYPKGPFDEKGESSEYRKLVSIFEGLENPWIRELSLRLLNDPQISSRYPKCPAAKTIHHAFLGGLLAHTLSLIRVVEAICPLYPELNREILLFGAAFHDFGKVFELSFDGPFNYTDEGKLIGHISIGQVWIDRKIQTIEGFPSDLELQLKHMVLSHHGRLDYGSPKVPQTLEAIVLSSLDDLDSRIESISQWIKAAKGTSRWTPVHKAYQVAFYRPDTSRSE